MQVLNVLRCIPRQSCSTIHRIGVLIDTQKFGFAGKAPTLEGVPEKPKKPGGAFLMFFQNIRENLRAQYPNASYHEILRTAGEMWKNCDDETKARFVAAHKTANVKYVEALHEYETNLTPEQANIIAEHRNAEKATTKMKKRRERETESSKPKKPPNAFGLFLTSMKDSVKDYDNTKDWLKNMTQKWKDLPEEEKNSYVIKAKELRVAHKTDVQKWAETNVDSAENSVITSKQKRHDDLLEENSPNELRAETKAEPNSMKSGTISKSPSAKSATRIVQTKCNDRKSKKADHKMVPNLIDSDSTLINDVNVTPKSTKKYLASHQNLTENIVKTVPHALKSDSKTKKKSVNSDIKITLNFQKKDPVTQKNTEESSVKILPNPVERDTQSEIKSVNSDTKNTSNSEKNPVTERTTLSDLKITPNPMETDSPSTTETKSLDSEKQNHMTHQSSKERSDQADLKDNSFFNFFRNIAEKFKK